MKAQVIFVLLLLEAASLVIDHRTSCAFKENAYRLSSIPNLNETSPSLLSVWWGNDQLKNLGCTWGKQFIKVIFIYKINKINVNQDKHSLFWVSFCASTERSWPLPDRLQHKDSIPMYASCIYDATRFDTFNYVLSQQTQRGGFNSSKQFITLSLCNFHFSIRSPRRPVKRSTFEWNTTRRWSWDKVQSREVSRW